MAEETLQNEEVTVQDPPSGNQLLSVDEFAAKIKEKYPSYNDMDNLELVTKIIEKYPTYKGQVDISSFSQKKNPDDTSSSDLATGTTVSTTETEGVSGFSDSLEENKITYISDDLDELISTAVTTAVPRGGMVVKTKPKKGLREKIKSDPNIIDALKNGDISEDEITDALEKGDSDAIKKIRELAVKNPETYLAEYQEKEYDKEYAYADESDISWETFSEDELKSKKDEYDRIKKKDEAFQDFINKKYLKYKEDNPNLSEYELSDYLYEITNNTEFENRPTDEEYDILSNYYVPESYEAKNSNIGDSNLSKMYSPAGLAKLATGSPEDFLKDFEGYLKSKGYMQEYLRLVEQETIDDEGVSGKPERYIDYTGGHKPILAAERLKAQYLNNYLQERINRSIDKQVLKYQAENNGRLPWTDGVELSISSGIDKNALENYIKEEMPMLTMTLEERDEKNAKNYKDYLNGENPWFRQSVKQGFRALIDRIDSVSDWVYGSSFAGDEVRMLMAERQLERDDFGKYAYIQGKELKVDGQNYLLDSRGQLYNTDIKSNVTNFITPEEYVSIASRVKKNGKSGSSFSGSGAVVTGTGVAADVLLQLAVQRGFGNVGTLSRLGVASYLPKGKQIEIALRSVPINATTTTAVVSQGMLFSSNLSSRAYQTALNSGLSVEQAAEIRQEAAIQGYVLGAFTAPISTMQPAVDKIFGKTASDKISKGMIEAYMNGGRSGLKGYLQNMRSTLISNYPTYLKLGGQEFFQENVQQAGEVYKVNPDLNELAGREIMQTTITGQEFINISGMAFGIGMLMPFGGDMFSVANQSIKATYLPGDAAYDRLVALNDLSKNPSKTKDFLASMVAQKVYTQDQADALMSDIDAYRNNINSIPPELSPETSLVVLGELNEINKLKKLKEQRDEAFHGDIDQRIDEIRNNIKSRTQFDFASPEGKLKLKEQAAKELQQEAEQRGEEEFNITDGAITARAIDNFSKLSAEEKLEFTDKTKVVIKKTDQDASTEQSAMEKTSADTTQDTQEMAEGVSDTVQQPTREGETEVETTTDQETQTEPVEETEEERIRDSQIPVSQQKFTLDMAGDPITAIVTTRLDGSRQMKLQDEDGTTFTNETISKDNTLSNEEYVTNSVDTDGGIQTTEEVDITTVRNPKMEEKMSNRQRKAAGMSVEGDTNVDTEQEVMSVNEVESAPSKDRVDQIVQDIITKTKGRKVGENTNPDIILENTLNYLQNSKFYQEANDVDREEAVRQLNQELGIEITKAPTVKKILGKPKDKQVTVNERTALKDQLRLQAKAARESQLDYRQKQKQVIDGVNSLQKGGQLSPIQSRALRNKIKKTNFDNDNQVESLLEYADKVFTNADYAAQEQQANTLNTRTRKKLNKGRLGNNPDFNNTLSQILSTPISEIKPEDLNAYNEFLNKISKREKVTRVDKDIQQEAETLLNTIKVKPQEVESEITFDKDKGFVYKEGTQKIIDKINSTDVDGETLLEENQSFIENDLDKLNSVSLETLVNKINLAETESNKEIVDAVNDYAKTRQNIINDISKQASNTNLSNLPSTARDQSVGAKTLTGIKKPELAFLSGTELNQLQIHLDNIADGIFTYSANKLAQKIEANKRAAAIKPIIDKANIISSKVKMARSRAAATIKNQAAKMGLTSKDASEVGVVGQMIRSNPLSVIDDVFGNMKSNTIRENIFDPIASQYAQFKNWINDKTDKLERVEQLLAPKGTEGINESIKRRFEVTTYLLQKEFEGNPGRENMGTSIQFIDKTIEKYNKNPRKSVYTDKDIDILKSIKEEYSENGEISLKKMEDKMSANTKKAITILEDVYGGLGEMQVYATTIVRGDELDLVNNYVHHKVEYSKGDEDTQLKDAVQYMDIQPGTKSKTSIKRTPGAKAIDFDPISTALRGVRNTGLDYYISNELSTTRQALTETVKVVDDKAATKEAAQDLKTVFDQAVANVVQSNMSVKVSGGKFFDFSRRVGYYAALASAPRAVAEFTSNLAFASMASPNESFLGMTTYADLSLNEDGRLVIENTGATVNTKLYNDEQLGGSKADQQGIVRKGKKQSARAKGELGELGEKIVRFSKLKDVGRGIEKTAEFLISTPDQMISRPLWFGTFATKFKEITGKKPDFKKIADNDSSYMEENSEAIKKSRIEADASVTRAATSNSPFSGVLKNQAVEGESFRNWYRMVNSYMARFSLNEYATARQAVASLVGQGQMGTIRAAGTLAAVLTRMSLYVILYKALSNALYSALGFGDGDDEDYAMLAKRQLVGAATSLITRGMAGNVPMLPINMGVEKLNEEFGYEFGLRDEFEYNPYEHSIVFSAVNRQQLQKNPYKQALFVAFGPLTPQIKSLVRIGELSNRALNNKTAESREENLRKLLSWRTGIEVANMFGGVPLYRDIRGGMLREEFKKEPIKIDKFNIRQMKEFDPSGYMRIQKDMEKVKRSPQYKKMMKKQEQIKKKLKKIENK